MTKTPEYNVRSTYRDVSWEQGDRHRTHYLGQRIKAYIDPSSGAVTRGTIWSIDDTSYKVDNLFFKEQYTIKLRNKDGVVYDYFTIISPKNITFKHNYEELIEV